MFKEQRRYGDNPRQPNYPAALVWGVIATFGVVMVWGVVERLIG